jgi:general secretion pathway protein A
MCESRFGLRRRAFPATPDHTCYYPATTHEQALQQLQEGLADGEGILLLVGEPGTGKTLLGHCLLDRLGPTTQAAFLTQSPTLARSGLLLALLYDLSLPHQGLSEQEMRLSLIDHLLEQYSQGKRLVLIIDEAQQLSVEQLEELRLLGNLEGHAGKAVQIVLLAQSSILPTIARPELASLNQRLVVRVQLEPLPVEEAADYLLHHLRLAGGQAEAILGSEALQELARHTGGVPRRLNQAAHLALRLAQAAGAPEVELEIAQEALIRLGLFNEPADEKVQAGLHIDAREESPGDSTAPLLASAN